MLSIACVPFPPSAATEGPVATPLERLEDPAQATSNDPIEAMFGATIERVAEDAAVRPTETRRPIGVLVSSDGRRIELDRAIIVGRYPQPDPDMPDARLVGVTCRHVSRRHLTVQIDGWAAMVADAGSTNGTFVVPPGGDQQRLDQDRPHPLVLGDTIRVGPVRFVLEALA